MGKERIQDLRLGIFVVTGTLLLIVAFYLIGNKQNLFGSTFRISAYFHNVGGLMSGNNVRYAGIDVGTVETVEIVSDTSVKVVMLLDEKIQKFLKKNCKASVGTDGLMGNKLVNINSASEAAPLIEDGDVIQTIKPIETDEMVRTLNTTNENMKEITSDLHLITQKINNSNSLWSLLMDTVMAENVKNAIVSIRLTGDRTATVAGDLSGIMNSIKQGNGTLGALITDTSFSGKLNQAIVNVDMVSDKLAVVTGDLSGISEKIKNGEGSVGALLMDTTFVHNLNASINSINKGAEGFSENMEALKHSFLLRKYFRKKARK